MKMRPELGLGGQKGGNRAERVEDKRSDELYTTRFTNTTMMLAHSRHLIMVS